MKNTEIPAGYVLGTPIFLSYGCDLNAISGASKQYAQKLNAIKFDKRLYFNETELRAAIEESRAQLKPDAVLASTIAEENGVSRRAIEKIARSRKMWRGYYLGRLYVSRSDFSGRIGIRQKESKTSPTSIPAGYISTVSASAFLGIESPFPLGSFLRYNKDIPRIVENRGTFVDLVRLVEAYNDPKRKGRASLGARRTFSAAAPEPAPAPVAIPAPALSAPADSMPSVTAFLVTTEDRKPDPAVKAASPALPAPLAPASSLSALLPMVVVELRAASFSGTAKLDMQTGKLIATRIVRVEVEL